MPESNGVSFPPVSLRPLTRRWWIVLILGFLALVAAHGMALLYRVQPQVSLWFPPSGVAIVLTFWFGPVGAFLTGMVAVLMAPLWGSPGWHRLAGLADMVEPLVAWWFYCRIRRGYPAPRNLKDASAFIMAAPLVGAAAAASLGSGIQLVLGNLTWDDLGRTIPHWWLGNSLGILTIAPVVLLLGTDPLIRRGWLPKLPVAESLPPSPPLSRVWLEVGSLALLAVFTSALTVSQAGNTHFRFQQFSFLSFIPILWAAIRFGVVGSMLTASLCVFVTLLAYLVAYPNAMVLPTFPVEPEVLHVHKLSLVVQCAVSLVVGTAITERTTVAVALAVERVRMGETQAQAALSEQLLQLNQSLADTNTQLEATNRQLQRSEEQFRTSVENLLDGFGIYSAVRDGDGNIQDFHADYINAAAFKHTPPSQAVDRRGETVLPGHHNRELFADYCRVVETGEPLIRDSVVYEEGEGDARQIRAFDIRAVKFGDGFVGTWHDISDRKRAEDALRQSEARFRRLVDSNLIGVMFADATGRVFDANDALLQMLGYTRQDLQAGHLNWQDLTPVDHRERDEAANRQLALTGVCTPFEKDYLHRSGRRIPVLLGVALLDGEGGDSVGFTLDLTEQKRIEAERTDLLQREQSARHQAESASRLKDEFLAIVSHELRSPLNAMLGWSRLLRTRNLDAATTERALETIERNAQAQTQLIEDLLDISRIIRGRIRLYSRPLNLLRVVETAVDTVRPSAQAKQIGLETCLHLTRVVSGDPDRLQQVVWNLLSNAVKFTPEGGRVTVTLEQVEGMGETVTADALSPSSSYAQITVMDTGKGISPDFLPYVFDRFRQENASADREHGGLGLGLAIVRSLVELHGGTVFATSPGEGQGSTFVVRLPLAQEMVQGTVEETGSTATVPEAASPLRGVRVLVVEDEADARDFLTAALQQWGAVVTAAASTREALQCLSQVQPQVLLSDIGMPEEDGYVLIREVRSLPADQGGAIPAIAVTAYARQEDRLRAIQAGFQRHLAKPIDPLLLVAVIEELTGGPADGGSSA